MISRKLGLFLVTFLLAGLIVTPLVVKAVCSDSQSVSAGKTQFLVELPPPKHIEQIEKLEWSVAEVIADGRKNYRRSCIRCHGINPQNLPHSDQLGFIERVRNGGQRMPALNFKLNAVEAEMIRYYLSYCAADSSIC